MSSTVRACPSCKTTLPLDAVFGHKCGASTPMEIVAATGEIHAPELSGLEEQARRAVLQVAVGDTVEIRRLLGRGGFAEVYVAYDRRLKREIAVKTIRGDLVVNDTLLERFQREAEAVAKLRHPHVIPIYSVGESNGVAYFTMPLIEGESLADLLEREGRLSVAEGCRILREASNALHAAHRAGLVHRDIKPENIMLEGPERTAVVMDFGIAKTEGPEAKGLTGTGMLVGTPQYMSPEQATGERALDARSDQYSLAMVGYRMLTGRFPFAGDSIQQLIFKTVTEVPVPASDLSSDVPRELSNVLAKALSKAAGDRYESMAAFATAVSATDRDLAGGPAGRGWRGRDPDMATRIEQALANLPRWRNPLLALALAALVGSLVSRSMLTSDAGVAVAASRSEAVFAAKTFLTSRGIAVTSGAYPDFVTREHAQDWMEGTIGHDSSARRSVVDIPIWIWSVKFGKMESGMWTVDVGAGNRIVGFARYLPDSAAMASVSHDSARALAEREIVARGWTLSQLRLTTDSTIRRKRRVDHYFRWRQQHNAIAGRGADTAFIETTATVRGDQVADYATLLRLPESHEAEHETKMIYRVATGIGWTIVVVLCAFAFGFGVTRQRIDQLQWAVVLRLLGVAAGALCVIGLPLLVNGLATARTSRDIVGMLIGFPIIILMVASAVLFTSVTGESLAKEKRPLMVQGMEDLSRGRLMIPEVMSGVFWGYLFGFIGAGIMVLADLVALHAFDQKSVAGKVSVVFDMSLPSTFALVTLASAIIGAFAILYAVAFFARWRATARAALVLPGIVAALTFVAAPDLTGVQLGVLVLILSFVIWRYGFIAALFALWMPDVIKDGVALLSSGSTEFATAGVVTIALAAAPLVMAVALYRRYQRAA